MRIAYLCLEPTQSREHISGYAVHLNAMIGAFREAGHEVGVVVLGEWRGHRQTATAAGNGQDASLKGLLKRAVPDILWQSAKDLRVRWWDHSYRERYRRFLQDFRPDVIYEQTAFGAESGRRLADELNLPRMAELHAPMVEERTRDGRRSLITPRMRHIEMRNLEGADCIRVVSSPLRDYLVKRGIPGERILVQPNGTDTRRFHPGAGDGLRIRKTYGLEGRFVFGFTGSFFRWHRIDALIRALASIKPECPGAAMLIVGDGEDADKLRRLAVELHVDDQVRFTGNVPHGEMVDYYAAMDVCCLGGTAWYCSPLKLLEYGALRKAVIAPDQASVRDFMDPGRDGLLVPPEDMKALAEAMRLLYTDRTLRERLAQAFHEKIRSRYDWSSIARNILDRLQRIVALPGSKPS